MPRCLSEGVDIFLKSVERQGGVNRRFTTGGRCHGWQLETRHQGVTFRSPRAFEGVRQPYVTSHALNEINVPQKALHIYFIDGCRRIKIERNNLLCEQAPTEVFRSIFAWLVTFNLV